MKVVVGMNNRTISLLKLCHLFLLSVNHAQILWNMSQLFDQICGNQLLKHLMCVWIFSKCLGLTPCYVLIYLRFVQLIFVYLLLDLILWRTISYFITVFSGELYTLNKQSHLTAYPSTRRQYVHADDRMMQRTTHTLKFNFFKVNFYD